MPFGCATVVRAVLVTSFDNRDSSRARFGELEFRGGLALTCSYGTVSGISVIHVEPDGSHFFGSHQQRLLAARAHHVRKRQATGRAPRWFDTESLAEVDCKQLYVGIERVEKIVRFEYRRYGLATRGEPIKVPNDFKTFTYTKSLECLAGCCYLPWCGSSARE